LFERRQKRLFSQRSAGLVVTTSEFYVPFSNRSGEEGTPVGGQFEQGSHPHQRVVLSAHVGRGAAPSVTAWGIDQTRSHGVELNIPRGGQQIRLIERE
jgi:hypothetical protein